MSEYIANKQLAEKPVEPLMNQRPPIKPHEQPPVKPDPNDHKTWGLA